jgi:hypothetical protein
MTRSDAFWNELQTKLCTSFGAKYPFINMQRISRGTKPQLD